MSDAKILVLIGTKAQFIKMAPVLCELSARGTPYHLVYTGQHSETFDVLESAFGISGPDDILVPNFEAATHASFLTWCWRYWSAVIKRLRSGAWKKFRIGLVHGDTASALFGAIAMRLAGAGVGHVEAGLRSPRLMEPFPEEIIRRLVSRLSRWHFAPDAQAVANLRGARGEVICTEGNTLRDALGLSLRRIDPLPAHGGSGGYAIVSLHRNENLSNAASFDFLMGEVVDAATKVPLKFVLHPATRARLRSSGWLERLQRHPYLDLMERMDYPDFVRLLLGSRFLMTDGGSNQEEAAMLGLPTLLMRNATERSDGLGQNVLLSGMQQQVIRDFVNANAATSWPLRSLDERSPTLILVDAMESALNRAKPRPDGAVAGS